jgi:hypothetical protein
MNARAKALLSIDAGAACAAGLTGLALRDYLVRLHALPAGLLLFVAVANLTYASYSGTLAALAWRGKTPSRLSIDILVLANLTWVAVCIAIVVATWRSASIFGLAQVALEGLFVCSLAVAEYRLVRPHAR